MSNEGEETLTDQIRAKVRQREAESFAKQNASMLAEAERTAGIQRSRVRQDNLIKIVVSGLTVGFACLVLWFLFGSGEPEAPKTAEQVRESQITRAFSAWDGSHRDLTRQIKAAMNDPDSFEHVDTRYRDNGDHIVVTTTFRGTNAFGGKVLNTWTAKASIDGTVTEIISTQ